MTVQELIDRLTEFPASATVLIYDWNEDFEPPYKMPPTDENGQPTIRFYPTWNEVVLADCSALPWWHRET